MKKTKSKKYFTTTGNKILMAIISGIFIISSFTAVAQKKMSFEFRTGIDLATKHLGDARLKTGIAFEGSFAFKFMPHFAAYAGWSWNKFYAAKSFAGNDVNFEETGYSFGVEFIHPVATSKVSYFIKGGGTYNHIETENSNGKIINDTGHGLGWQLGLGIAIPLGEKWLLIPEARYRSLSRDINIGEAKTPLDLNYISPGLGISFSF
jgi:Outer membrane protein beta-barrel domain